MANIKQLNYRSWSEFKAQFYIDLFGKESFQPETFLFRGQGSAAWSLSSSFDRWHDIWGSKRNRVELSSILLKEFLSTCEEQGFSPGDSTEDIQVLALAQHYGLPTRLLDWTESPYVASYFAFSNHLSSAKGSDHSINEVAIWCLSLQAPIWGKEHGVEVVRVPRLTNIRLRNQSGLFTVSRTPFNSLEEYVAKCRWDGVGLIKAILPTDEIVPTMTDLRAMGISAARLFPDTDGAARAALERSIQSII